MFSLMGVSELPIDVSVSEWCMCPVMDWQHVLGVFPGFALWRWAPADLQTTSQVENA